MGCALASKVKFWLWRCGCRLLVDMALLSRVVCGSRVCVAEDQPPGSFVGDLLHTPPQDAPLGEGEVGVIFERSASSGVVQLKASTLGTTPPCVPDRGTLCAVTFRLRRTLSLSSTPDGPVGVLVRRWSRLQFQEETTPDAHLSGKQGAQMT